MGTYTTNYQLYTPTVGETGWGTLVNGNFITIDTTMKGLDTRLTVVENEVNGVITGNGGIAGTTGTFSGAVTGASFNGVILKSSGTITVTPSNNNKFYKFQTGNRGGLLILPPIGTVLYTGKIRIKNFSSSGELFVDNGVDGTVGGSFPVSGGSIGGSAILTYTFSNIPYLKVYAQHIYGFGYEPVILS